MTSRCEWDNDTTSERASKQETRGLWQTFVALVSFAKLDDELVSIPHGDEGHQSHDASGHIQERQAELNKRDQALVPVVAALRIASNGQGVSTYMHDITSDCDREERGSVLRCTLPNCVQRDGMRQIKRPVASVSRINGRSMSVARALRQIALCTSSPDAVCV
jgi:hypothetical protein